MSFIDSYLEYTKDYESSTAFWKWSAYTTIAGVLRNSCFIRQRDLEVYPNIYTLLLAPSGVDRKNMPVVMSEKLVRSVSNTKIISGRTSIQALIQELSQSQTSEQTGRIVQGGSSIFFAPELAAAIVGDPASVGILTDIYDTKGDYSNSLKGGSFKIKNVCLSMFAASNVDMLKNEGLFDAKGTYGGLLARTFLIRPDEFRKGSSLFNSDEEAMKTEFKRLSHELREIGMRQGAMILEDAAQKAWEDWYFPFRMQQRDRTDKSGVNSRIHTSILKLAIIICVAETKQQIIRVSHIQKAIKEAMSLLPNYQEFVMGQGKSSVADIGTIILKAIYHGKDHGISKKELLQRHWNDFSHEELEKIAATFTEAGLIKLSPSLSGDIGYTMTETCIKKLFPEGGK